MEGLGPVDMDALFTLPKDYWVEDAKEARKFLDDQVRTTCETHNVQICETDQLVLDPDFFGAGFWYLK